MSTIISVCVPPHMTTREQKLKWMDQHVRGDLFLTPQEYFGGVMMADDMYMRDEWLRDKVGSIARRHCTHIGIGAVVERAYDRAYEVYMYFDSSGEVVGEHAKLMLPQYDSATRDGATWLTEGCTSERVRPIALPKLSLRIGTVFCWEVFSQRLWGEYALRNVNLVVHPIKFAPGAAIDYVQRDGLWHIGSFSECKTEVSTWTRRLRFASEFQVMCPIAVCCNTWAIGEQFTALVGWIDECFGGTSLNPIPCRDFDSALLSYEMHPRLYDTIGSKLHWTLCDKMRKREAPIWL